MTVVAATISRTEYLGEHRGHRLYRDWCRAAGRWNLCVGYRASSAPRDVRGAIDDDPDDVRDGEAPHFDSEDDVRAAIDATFEAPGEAA